MLSHKLCFTIKTYYSICTLCCVGTNVTIDCFARMVTPTVSSIDSSMNP